MLWYVEQTVPDPSCSATGDAKCPTITALMPQVYLPSSTTALSAGGNIIGQDVTLDFKGNGQGSVLNTGNILASGTLKVDTPTLTNQANQVNVGQVWSMMSGGYMDMTGTQVQPGGFMSAANMDLNVQTLSQIGGALQKLNADGTVDQAGTQQLLAALGQQLGTNFTQQTLADDLHYDFAKQGGSFNVDTLAMLFIAVVLSIITYGAASAYVGATLGAEGGTFAAGTAATTTSEGVATSAVSAGLGNTVVSAGIAGVASSAGSQAVGNGHVDWGSAFETGAIAAVTAGLTNGITYNAQSGLSFTTQPIVLDGSTSTLSSLAGVNPAIGNTADQATQTTASSIATRGLAMLGEAGISAGVSTAIEGGSFGNAFKNAFVNEVSAAAAFEIGNGTDPFSIKNILEHALLGCATGAALGTGCSSSAIGGAVGALTSPWTTYAMMQTGAPEYMQDAIVAGIATLFGGVAAGALGQNAAAGAAAAQNEALNNVLQHRDKVRDAIEQVLSRNKTLASRYSVDTLMKGADNAFGMRSWASEADAKAATAQAGTTYFKDAAGRYEERWDVPVAVQETAQNIVLGAQSLGPEFRGVTWDNWKQLTAGWIRDYGTDPSNFQGAAELGATLGALGTIGRKDAGLVSNATSSAPSAPVYNPQGAARATANSSNWSNGSLSETVQNVVGSNPQVTYTESGKTIYTNPTTGTSVVYDNAGNYYRVQNAAGQYLDRSGNLIPNNVPLIGPNKTTQTGVPSGVRNGLTHFNNSDPVK